MISWNITCNATYKYNALASWPTIVLASLITCRHKIACDPDSPAHASLISAQIASLSSLCNISQLFWTPFKPHRTPKLLEGLHASAKIRGVPGRRGQYKASRLCCSSYTVAFRLLLPSAFLAPCSCPSAVEANLSSRPFPSTGRRFSKGCAFC